MPKRRPKGSRPARRRGGVGAFALSPWPAIENPDDAEAPPGEHAEGDPRRLSILENPDDGDLYPPDDPAIAEAARLARPPRSRPSP